MHDKTTGKTFLKFDQSKCLHYYFYFIDKELGFCYLRVPTWTPFRLQFYMNGHNLLASKLQKKEIAYRMYDNAFLEISDMEAAQKLSDRINPEDLHKVLDVFAKRYCPVPETLGLSYTWIVQQNSLYQLFTIMKAANYRYLEFVSSFDDHSRRKENLTKVTESVVDKGRSYRGLNFFAERDLQVLEVISWGEYMTFGIQGKDIRQHFKEVSPSAMSRIFKRLRLHGIIERVQGTYKYFATAYGKEIIAAGLTVKNLVLIPALA